MKPINIFLVDDHSVVRLGLRTFLESFPDIDIVGEAPNGEAMVEALNSLTPDVVIMDLYMPGGMDGFEATKIVREDFPETQVVVLTAFTDQARVMAALRAGALGYARKDAAPEILLAMIRAAAQGQSMLDPTLAGSVLQDLVRGYSINEALTERELTVLKHLAHGRTNRQIADLLMVGEETVKTHVGNILGKLQMNHRTSAVVAALKQGLIYLEDIDL